MDFVILESLITSILIYEQNPKIISKMEKIDFFAKFAWKLKFHENRGKFELIHLFWVVIKYIMVIKKFISDF